MEIPFVRGPRSNQVVFSPRGDLDLYASVAFFNTVQAQFDRVANHLILDMSGVRYLDSSGVGALIRLAQYAKSVSGDIQLVNVTGTPRKVLEMSNVIRLFKLAPDVATALKEGE